MKGGSLIATDGNCSLGAPLGHKVDTFLGIAGPNYGLCVCQLAQTVPAWCNALDGLYPGYSCEDQVSLGKSAISECKRLAVVRLHVLFLHATRLLDLLGEAEQRPHP